MLVTTGLARKITDRCERFTRGRWLPTLLLVGGFLFLADELLSLPFAIAHFELIRSWGLSNRGLADWFYDFGKGLMVTAAIEAVAALGLYSLLRRFPRRWWLPATAAGTLLGIGFAYAAPLVIEPIFNTFTPLAQTQWANLEGMVARWLTAPACRCKIFWLSMPPVKATIATPISPASGPVNESSFTTIC